MMRERQRPVDDSLEIALNGMLGDPNMTAPNPADEFADEPAAQRTGTFAIGFVSQAAEARRSEGAAEQAAPLSEVGPSHLDSGTVTAGMPAMTEQDYLLLKAASAGAVRDTLQTGLSAPPGTEPISSPVPKREAFTDTEAPLRPTLHGIGDGSPPTPEQVDAPPAPATMFTLHSFALFCTLSSRPPQAGPELVHPELPRPGHLPQGLDEAYSNAPSVDETVTTAPPSPQAPSVEPPAPVAPTIPPVTSVPPFPAASDEVIESLMGGLGAESKVDSPPALSFASTPSWKIRSINRVTRHPLLSSVVFVVLCLGIYLLIDNWWLYAPF